MKLLSMKPIELDLEKQEIRLWKTGIRCSYFHPFKVKCPSGQHAHASAHCCGFHTTLDNLWAKNWAQYVVPVQPVIPAVGIFQLTGEIEFDGFEAWSDGAFLWGFIHPQLPEWLGRITNQAWNWGFQSYDHEGSREYRHLSPAVYETFDEAWDQIKSSWEEDGKYRLKERKA